MEIPAKTYIFSIGLISANFNMKNFTGKKILQSPHFSVEYIKQSYHIWESIFYWKFYNVR